MAVRGEGRPLHACVNSTNYFYIIVFYTVNSLLQQHTQKHVTYGKWVEIIIREFWNFIREKSGKNQGILFSWNAGNPVHTSSNRLLLSNQDKGCTPSVAHSLPLPLGPALLNLWTMYREVVDSRSISTSHAIHQRVQECYFFFVFVFVFVLFCFVLFFCFVFLFWFVFVFVFVFCGLRVFSGTVWLNCHKLC